MVVLAAALALFAGELGRWVGAGLVLWVLPVLVAPVRGHPVYEKIRPHLPLLLLGLLSLVLLGDLLLGRPPATRDHGVHYFQTHILTHDLIPSGRLTGWSDRLNNGYPFGDSYPVLAYLWVGAFHVLSFGLVSLRVSYAWGMLAVWLVSMWGIWHLAELVTHEIRERSALDIAAKIPTGWAGAIAAGLWLIDPGYSRQGGWHYVMYHGVWPQLLSSGLWIAAVPLTWRAFERASPRRIALAGLATAGAVLAHPFGLLTVVCSATMWLLALWGTKTMRELPGGVFRVWLLIHVAAALVSVGWVVGFLASADYMGRTPVPWVSLGELVTQLATGELFERHRAFAGPLALIGIVLAVRSGRTIAWLSMASLFAMLVASSEAAITILRLDLVVTGFKNLQFPRYAMALKPLWFALGGVGGALLVAVLTGRAPGPAAKASAGRLLACALFGPLLVAFVDDASRLVPYPTGSLMTIEGSRYEVEERDLRQALEAEKATLTDRTMTVAFMRTDMGGGTYPLFSIADAGARVVLDGHIPSVNFRYRITRRNVGLLRLLGVTHVLHDRPLDGTDKSLGDELELVGEFGVYQLQRLLPAEEPDPANVDGRTLVSRPEGLVQVESWERERIVLDMPQMPPESMVQLTVAPYRKWVPRTEDGTALPVGGEAVLKGLSGLAFIAPGPGRVTLHYEKLRREEIAAWASAFGVGLCLLGLAFPRPLRMSARGQSQSSRKLTLGAAIVVGGLVLLLGVRRQRTVLAQTWQPVLDHHLSTKRLGGGIDRVFTRDLVDSRAYRIVIDPGDVCDGMLTKDSMPGCSEADQRPRVSMTYRSPYLYRCLRVIVPPRGLLEVAVDDLGANESVLGFFKRLTRGRGGDKLRWVISGGKKPRATRGTRRHFHAQPEDHQGTFVIQFQNENLHAERLCLSLAAAE